jgi:hypothetical protein
MCIDIQPPFQICGGVLNRMYNNNINNRLHHYHPFKDLRLLSRSGLNTTIQKSLLRASWVPFTCRLVFHNNVRESEFVQSANILYSFTFIIFYFFSRYSRARLSAPRSYGAFQLHPWIYDTALASFIRRFSAWRCDALVSWDRVERSAPFSFRFIQYIAISKGRKYFKVSNVCTVVLIQFTFLSFVQA